MLMHAIVHRDARTPVRESALKVDSGREIPRRTGELNLRQRRAGPMLYQLSYIPTHKDNQGRRNPKARQTPYPFAATSFVSLAQHPFPGVKRGIVVPVLQHQHALVVWQGVALLVQHNQRSKDPLAALRAVVGMVPVRSRVLIRLRVKSK